MGIKKNIAIAAEQYAVKPSRLAAIGAMQQATRELLADEQVRPTARKPKKGKQAERGRVRVERAREVELETSRTVREIYAEMMDIIREMEKFAAENPTAYIRWSYDRRGRGMVIVASPGENIPSPICSIYPVTEEGLRELREYSGWMA